MEQDRRENDFRLDSIDCKIMEIKDENKEMLIDIIYIKTKIDNGFSTSIKSTENKVDYIDQANKDDHKKLSNDIKDVDKKIDKLLWFIALSSVVIVSTVLVKPVEKVNGTS